MSDGDRQAVVTLPEAVEATAKKAVHAAYDANDGSLDIESLVRVIAGVLYETPMSVLPQRLDTCRPMLKDVVTLYRCPSGALTTDKYVDAPGPSEPFRVPERFVPLSRALKAESRFEEEKRGREAAEAEVERLLPGVARAIGLAQALAEMDTAGLPPGATGVPDVARSIVDALASPDRKDGDG